MNQFKKLDKSESTLFAYILRPDVQKHCPTYQTDTVAYHGLAMDSISYPSCLSLLLCSPPLEFRIPDRLHRPLLLY